MMAFSGYEVEGQVPRLVAESDHLLFVRHLLSNQETSPHTGLTLDRRLRRRPSIDPILSRCLVFAEISFCNSLRSRDVIGVKGHVVQTGSMPGEMNDVFKTGCRKQAVHEGKKLEERMFQEYYIPS